MKRSYATFNLQQHTPPPPQASAPFVLFEELPDELIGQIIGRTLDKATGWLSASKRLNRIATNVILQNLGAAMQQDTARVTAWAGRTANLVHDACPALCSLLDKVLFSFFYCFNNLLTLKKAKWHTMGLVRRAFAALRGA